MEFFEVVIKSLGVLTLLGVIVFYPAWGVVDAALTPDGAWRAASRSRKRWIVYLITFNFFATTFYAAVIRPRLKHAMRTTGVLKINTNRRRRLLLIGTVLVLAILEFAALKYSGSEIAGNSEYVFPVSEALRIQKDPSKPYRADFLVQDRHIHVFAIDADGRVHEFFTPLPEGEAATQKLVATFLQHGFSVTIEAQRDVQITRMLARVILPGGIIAALAGLLVQNRRAGRSGSLESSPALP